MTKVQSTNIEELKTRAAEAGMSLADYMLQEYLKTEETITMEELFRRLQSREPVKTSISAAEILREERDRR